MDFSLYTFYVLGLVHALPIDPQYPIGLTLRVSFLSVSYPQGCPVIRQLRTLDPAWGNWTSR